MSKSKELKTTTDMVKHILETVPMARNSDNHLYYWVCAMIGKQNGVDIHKMSMPMFLLHLKEYGFPQFESVRRARQKLQAEYPELAGTSTVEGQRMLNEEVFRDYARGIV